MPIDDRNGSTAATFKVNNLASSGASVSGNLAVTGSLTVGGTALPMSTNSGFKNLIINPSFVFAQRGTSFTLADNTIILDRWVTFINGGSGGTAAAGTVSQQSFTPGQGVVTGEPSNYFSIQNTSSGTSLGVDSYHLFLQKIDNVRTLAGQTCSISFWAQSSISGKKISVNLSQVFGSGGSSNVNILGISFTLTSTWQKFTTTFTVPSITGKTLGTGSYLQISFWLQAGSNFDSQTAASGGFAWGGTGTTSFSNVQVELGSQATGFEYRNYQLELSLCQYFYQKITVSQRFYSPSAGAASSTGFSFQTMRTNPSIALLTAGTKTNISGTPAAYIFSNNSGRFEIVSSSTGDCYDVGEIYTLSAEL